MIDSLTERLKQRLDRASLTLVVTEPDERRYMSDALVWGAVFFLIQRYVTGFLKGAGLDAMAERHGAAAATFAARLRADQVTEEDLAVVHAQVLEAVAIIRGRGDDQAARRSAEAEVASLLTGRGAIGPQASDAARMLSQEILG